eukprot:SAG31_NODE_16179_length_720_cov_0.723027_1_plen_226_part_01
MLKKGDEKDGVLGHLMRPCSKRIALAQDMTGAKVDRAALSEENRVRNRFRSRIFLILYLMYPTLVQTIFETFNCRQLDYSLSFHRSDYSLSCNSDLYTITQIYAYFAVALMPLGIPLVFLFLLVVNRKRLATNTDGFDFFAFEALAREYSMYENMPRWAWIHEGSGHHQLYDEHIQEKLRTLEMSQNKSCRVLVGIETYTVDLRTNTETLNTDFQAYRSIRQVLNA